MNCLGTTSDGWENAESGNDVNETNERIKALYALGVEWTYAKIAEELGLGPSLVKRRIAWMKLHEGLRDREFAHKGRPLGTKGTFGGPQFGHIRGVGSK
jgi:hypothetical protein